MPKKDARVNVYIAKSADFAKPILTHIRKVVHAACPEVEETLKWGFPHFLHKGVLCSMASFKEHCSLGFWKGALIFTEKGTAKEGAMGHFGRITAVSDLPDKTTLAGYVKAAARLNEEGIKKPAPARSKKNSKLEIPGYFWTALRKSRKAFATFDNFSPSHKKEYVDWITEAKREETRVKRLSQAIEWMAEGKPRNWKYANC